MGNLANMPGSKLAGHSLTVQHASATLHANGCGVLSMRLLEWRGANRNGEMAGVMEKRWAGPGGERHPEILASVSRGRARVLEVMFLCVGSRAGPDP